MIEANFIYIDKTDLLYEIASLKTAFIINAERRTGKTLLLSSIKAIFEQPKSWWEEYGKNLKIWQLDPNFFDNNPYPVIHFNFANSRNNKAFINRIREAINNAITTYKLPLKDIEEKITLEELVDGKFADVFNKFLLAFQLVEQKLTSASSKINIIAELSQYFQPNVSRNSGSGLTYV